MSVRERGFEAPRRVMRNQLAVDADADRGSVLNAMHRTFGNAAVGQLLGARTRNGVQCGAAPPLVAQRLMASRDFSKQYMAAPESDDTGKTVVRLLDAYHAARATIPMLEWTAATRKRASDARQEMLKRLNALNLVVYTWFDFYRSLDLKRIPNSGVMFSLLDDVQQEHQELISTIAEHPGELPVSKVGLSDADQARVFRIWHGLVANEGNVQIAGDKDFRSEALAAFANLLQSQAGRDLVESLQLDLTRPHGSKRGAAARRISIVPVTSSGFAATPTNLDSTEHLLEKLGDQEDMKHSDKLRSLQPERNLTEQWWKRPGSTGFTVGKGDRRRNYRYGAGQGSTVAFPVGSRARSHGMKIDEQGKQILSPVFITLGHELYHARHYLEGMAFDSAQASSKSDREDQRLLAEASRSDAHDYEWYENTEEYITIAHNENYLREHYGLTPRATHTVQCMYLAGRLDSLSKRAEGPEQEHIDRLKLVLQKAGWVEIKKSKLDPANQDVIEGMEGDIGALLDELGMKDIGQVLERVEVMLRDVGDDKKPGVDAPPGRSIASVGGTTATTERAEPSRSSGVQARAPQLPGVLKNVSGEGNDCLIRAVLVAADVQNFDDDYVDGIREHIVSQAGGVTYNGMLDLARVEGAILLSYLQYQGLLDAGRGLTVYLATGVPITVQDGNNPVNIYLSDQHFQAIV